MYTAHFHGTVFMLITLVCLVVISGRSSRTILTFWEKMLKSKLMISMFKVLFSFDMILNICRCHMIPRWRGLTHFKNVVKVSFTDGKKFEHISKVLFYLIFNLLIYLYHLIRLSYLHLTMSLVISTQTSQAIVYCTAFSAF